MPKSSSNTPSKEYAKIYSMLDSLAEGIQHLAPINDVDLYIGWVDEYTSKFEELLKQEYQDGYNGGYSLGFNHGLIDGAPHNLEQLLEQEYQRGQIDLLTELHQELTPLPKNPRGIIRSKLTELSKQGHEDETT